MSFLSQSLILDSPNGKTEGLNVQSPDTDELARSPKDWPILSFCRVERSLDLGFVDYNLEEHTVNFLAMSPDTAIARLENSHKEALERKEPDLLADVDLVLSTDFYHEAAKNTATSQSAQDKIANLDINAQSLFAKNHGPQALAALKDNWGKFRSDYADPCFFAYDSLTIS